PPGVVVAAWNNCIIIRDARPVAFLIPTPVSAPGVMEFVGPLYALLLMPVVGLLLIVAGAACR
ncbi:MAG: hypothetical protein PHU37_11165, partial [Methanoculleus chikugoensis]|nr:hypothetical protein [Methanoculleus chikugoensis]